MTKENNKGKPNGFNVYKNNSFLFVVSTDDEKEVKRHIIDYVKVNNFNLSDYSYKRFENHNSDNFEMVSMEITYAQITSFTNAFQHTCSDGWITDIVNGEVDIDKLKSFILTHYREHKDVDGNKVFDEDIEGYFTKDKCTEIFVKTEKEKSPIWFYDTFWSYDKLVEELENLKEKFNILDSDITSHLGNSGEEWQLNVLSTDTIPNYTTDELKKGETNESNN